MAQKSSGSIDPSCLGYSTANGYIPARLALPIDVLQRCVSSGTEASGVVKSAREYATATNVSNASSLHVCFSEAICEDEE